MRPAALSAFLVAVLTCLVSAQQPPVKTITTGVVVDVTVVDGKGTAVLDLAPEDFEVSEDGVRQRVVSATLVQRGVVRPLAAAAGSEPTAAPSAGAPAAANAPATGVAPATAVTPSVTAILFDRLSPESRPLAHRAALAYVSTLQPPHDYAGVFLADASLRTFQPFANERGKLARAIDLVSSTAPANTAAAAEPESKRTYGLDPNLPPTAGAESAGGGFGSAADRQRKLDELKGLGGRDPSELLMAKMELRMREDYHRLVAELDGEWSLAGLGAVISGLSQLPGRKSVLYFTEKLPITDRLKPRFDALIGEANRENITVYPVDAAGLRVHSIEGQMKRNIDVAGAQGVGDEQRDRGGWTKDLERQNDLLNSRVGAVLGRLAKDTGGFVLENTNDLAAGVARMQQERTTYYLLAYQPTNTKLDGKFRRITVKVKRPKTTVRSRPGYVAAQVSQ
jgi:VWFA-related protein